MKINTSNASKSNMDKKHDLIDDTIHQVKHELHEEEADFTLTIKNRRDERTVAFHLVYIVDRFDYTIGLDEAADMLLQGYGLPLPVDSFAMLLAQGGINDRDSLDEIIKPCLKNWKLERLGTCTHLILRMALWELQQPNSIRSIIINEAVELSKQYAEKDAYKFVNGMLDEICKRQNWHVKPNVEKEEE